MTEVGALVLTIIVVLVVPLGLTFLRRAIRKREIRKIIKIIREL